MALLRLERTMNLLREGRGGWEGGGERVRMGRREGEERGWEGDVGERGKVGERGSVGERGREGERGGEGRGGEG